MEPPNLPQTTARILHHNSQGPLLCKARWSRAAVLKSQGGTRNLALDLHNNGSACILSSNHWTKSQEWTGSVQSEKCVALRKVFSRDRLAL